MRHWGLGAELSKLEREDPAVGAAARSFNAMRTRVVEGRSHPLPCTDLSCEWHHEADDE